MDGRRSRGGHGEKAVRSSVGKARLTDDQVTRIATVSETRPALVSLVMGALILVALGLRVYRLEFHSLWSDELTTWWDVWRPTFGEFWQRYIGMELTPPLFFLLEFAVSRFAPASEWSLRLVSVAAGVGFVGAMFLFGRRLRGAWAGVMAAAFAVFSYRAILFSQEARSYSLLFFLVALSGWAWLRLEEPSRRRGRDAALYIGICVAMAYTHYFGVLMILAQALATLWLRYPTKETLSYWTKIYAAVLVGYLPWLWILAHNPLPQTSLHKQVPWTEIFVAHRELFGSSAANSALALLLGLFACVKSGERRRSLAIFSWVFIPFVLAMLISNWVKPIWGVRNYMVVLAPTLALAACGAYDLKRWSRRWMAAIAVIFVVLEVHQTFVARKFYFTPRSDQVREAIEASVPLLKEHPGASYVFSGLLPYQPSLYLDRFGAPREFSTILLYGWQLGKASEWTEEMQASSEWVIVAFADDVAETNASFELLAERFTVERRQDFNHATVALLRRR